MQQHVPEQDAALDDHALLVAEVVVGGQGGARFHAGEGEQSQRSSGLVYGIGAMVDLTPRFGLRAEWNEFRKLGDELTGGEFDTRVVSAGLQYRF